jgi:hypothetical protein
MRIMWRIDQLLGNDLETNEYSRFYAIGELTNARFWAAAR